eukprot:GFUD01022428.1.p1 GENE.GFUD01022428.1~~GFUD01022428.1.p1  ORF type:complete len:181 (-),score=49.13 GFUD01022428.1:65-607(-)
MSEENIAYSDHSTAIESIFREDGTASVVLIGDWSSVVALVFYKFDADGTGTVSISELGNIMRSIGMFPTDDEVDDLLQYMDGDGSGALDLSELTGHLAQQIHLRNKIDPEHDFKEAFLVFDKDGNGKISSEELTRVLTECGRMQLTMEEAEEFIAMVDTDGDGMLDYQEFVNLFTQKLGL